MDVAIFGGSFNPPHLAHVLACALVLAVEDIDKMLVVPTFRHPFAKALAPYEDRVAMCKLAFGQMPAVEVSRVEQELGGESRTLRTIEHLAAANPKWRLRLVVGADILVEAPRWYGFDAIAKQAPLIVLDRIGAGAPAAGLPLLPDVSSTAVRECVAAQDWPRARGLVPRGVLAYARERGLYAATS